MELSNIKIISVSETKRGKSTTTGKPWATKNILLGFEDETGESYISAAVDEDIWNTLGLSAGQVTSLNLRFRTRLFNNGYLANDVRIVPPVNA